jgi:hypothetical protein
MNQADGLEEFSVKEVFQQVALGPAFNARWA